MKPNKHKMALLTWLVIYPLITGIFYLFGQELMELPLVVRTFLLTVFLVALMNYFIMPRLIKRFQAWINRS